MRQINISRISLATFAIAGLTACGGGKNTPPLSTTNQTQIEQTNDTNGSTSSPSLAFIQDKTEIGTPYSGSIYPEKGTRYTDPITGLKYTRVADHTELTGDYGDTQSAISAIVYSRYTPTNTTGEFLIVHGANSTSGWIYKTSDNSMVTPIKFKPSLSTRESRSIGEVNEIRWDYSGTHPYRFYFVGRSIPSSQAVAGEQPGMSFYYIDVNPLNGQPSAPHLIRDFSSDFPVFASKTAIMNDVEGDSSNDSRYWAWQVMDTTLSTGYKPVAIFTYDMQSDRILGSIQRSCAGVGIPCQVIDTPATTAPYLTRPNMVEMSPLGTRVIVDWERSYSGHNTLNMGTVADGPKGFLPDFSDVGTPVRVGADATHSGWAWGANGEELFVSQNNRSDWIEAVDIASTTTANCTVISGNSYTCGTKVIFFTDMSGPDWSMGFHFGKVYDPNKKGWLFMNTYARNNNYWGKNQQMLIEVNNGQIRASKIVRFGSSYNLYYDYRSEGSGALDFQGNTIWTTGNMGFTDGRGDVIKVELPSNWFSSIQ